MIWLLIPYMAIMAAWAGGSLYGHQWFGRYDFVPEILFAIPFACALYSLIGWWCVLAGAWSYIWMQTGHANALPWGDGGHNPGRTNTLSPVVKWICDKLGVEYYSIWFARIFMAVKGFLITLPVGGLVGMVLWPLGYDLGHRLGSNIYRELLSGAGAGLSAVVFCLIFA